MVLIRTDGVIPYTCKFFHNLSDACVCCVTATGCTEEFLEDLLYFSETANKSDMTALFKIGYGLYVVTCTDGKKDNGLIVNTVSQVTNTPNRVAVTVNKLNYSCETIAKTGKLNISTLSQEAPFKLFQRFGFQSGKDTDKFAGFKKRGNRFAF